MLLVALQDDAAAPISAQLRECWLESLDPIPILSVIIEFRSLNSLTIEIVSPKLHQDFEPHKIVLDSPACHEADDGLLWWLHLQTAESWTVRVEEIDWCSTFAEAEVSSSRHTVIRRSTGACHQSNVLNARRERHFVRFNRRIHAGYTVQGTR